MVNVDARLPDGTFAQPCFAPTRSSYCLLEAHSTNLVAAAWFLPAFSMPHDQVYSQPEFFVLSTGAAT